MSSLKLFSCNTLRHLFRAGAKHWHLLIVVILIVVILIIFIIVVVIIIIQVHL